MNNQNTENTTNVCNGAAVWAQYNSKGDEVIVSLWGEKFYLTVGQAEDLFDDLGLALEDYATAAVATLGEAGEVYSDA